MRPTPTLSLALLALLPAFAGVPRADLIVVDDDGGSVDFTLLQAAIDSALDGDTILVREGSYAAPPAFPPAPLRITGKGLSLVADGVVRLESALEVQGTSAGQTVLVRGFEFDDAELLVEDTAGAVWIEDVRLTGTNFTSTSIPIQIEDGAAVHLVRVEATGISQIPFPQCALVARNSQTFLYDSVLVGGDGYTAISTGADAAVIEGGFLFASGSTLRGGGLGCGGNGLRLTGSTTQARTLDCTLIPGAIASCGETAGAPVANGNGDYLALTGNARSLTTSGPTEVGETVALLFSGQPFDLVFLNIAVDAGGLYLPDLGGVLQPSLGSLKVRSLGFLDGSGSKIVAVEVNPLGIEAVTVYLQATLVGSPTDLTLSSGSALVLTES